MTCQSRLDTVIDTSTGEIVMARFECSACARKGDCEYELRHHRCPLCGYSNVAFALSIDELPEELVAAPLDAEPLHVDNEG